MKKKQRKYFLLVEVLIALMLLSLAFMPILTPQILQYKSKKEFLDQVIINRIALENFVDIKQKLYKNEIPLNAIVRNSRRKKMNFGRDHGLSVKLNLPNNYYGECELFRLSKSGGARDDITPFHLIVINMRFSTRKNSFNEKNQYTFSIPIEKIYAEN